MPCITFLAAKILCCFKGFYSDLQGHLLPAAAKCVEKYVYVCVYVCVCVYLCTCLYRCKHTHIGVNTHKKQETSAYGGGFFSVLKEFINLAIFQPGSIY